MAAILFATDRAAADTLYVTDDTFINPNQPADNKGDRLNVVVRDAPVPRRGFAKFDISTLPSSTAVSDIDSATLRFWVKDVNAPGTIDIYLVNGAWDEMTLTPNNEPPTGATPVASISPGQGSRID